ncbi:MAG: ribbon-helix-helix domain-containing protein [Verrucomicrobia bacterium]|nr:ribbon-helix-helix domain-containing protein [Verrucomicrobiota bacterium]MBU4247888.1 ribbon-helix-helix domain-containing protein [Verrucomicrobiota bacterium]MBU4292252.1 ribbon-helix-helix domain-containing protein [Verrucomicrobiota bacterium]MBU4427979.1 ribbon-helix-helix domain-containing protein [Verrucomicrobiota bacterium]MBU4498030.1 ribbon-helix-helix domain-containing protein [Verrucomicrobiota bacterium]
MVRKCLKIIWLPCDLKARVKRLARVNGMTASELIRLSIEARLPDYEAGISPSLKGVDVNSPGGGKR